MEDRQDIFAKSVALRLLDDEGVGRSFIADIEIRYCASEVTYLFQNLSQAFFDLIVAAAGAFLVYKFYQQPKEKQSREESISRIKKFLKENNKKIKRCLKHVEDKIDQFDEMDEIPPKSMVEERIRQGKSEVILLSEIKDEVISRRKQRLKAFSEKVKELKPSKKTAELILETMEKESQKTDSDQRRHIDEFRSYRVN